MIADALRLKESQEQIQAAKRLQNLGRVEEALTAFARAVELDPNQTTALDSITDLRTFNLQQLMADHGC